jgi:endoglycosylceramidase
MIGIAPPTLPSTPARETRLGVRGRHFVDERGRVVILRGVNLAGDSKIPPFSPCRDTADLDHLRDLGFNVIRLLFVWEAYEPSPGDHDEGYLRDLLSIVAAARERGISTIVDIHQDGFSRFASRGAGSGFPRWAISSRCRPYEPDNGLACKNWPIRMISDPVMHRSFGDFYADRNGVRTRFLETVARAAVGFASVPGVIGYDLLNEPWGDERSQIAPLYHEEARAIQEAHPSAILLVEGHIATNCGFRTRLPRPEFGSAVYAPHYYCPISYALGRWHGASLGLCRAFTAMAETAREWETPLFIGEFGMSAEIPRAGDYVRTFYDRLDAALASGAQWNYTPRWNAETKDGWNGEDFSILEPSGALRANFHPRPYPRATAGMPSRFHFEDREIAGQPRSLEFEWDHDPDRGETEIFVPVAAFPDGSEIEVRGAGVSCEYDPYRQVLTCRSPIAGHIQLRLIAPAETIRLATVEGMFSYRRIALDTRVRVC